MLRKYRNVTSVKGLNKWNSDIDDVLEWSMREQTKKMNVMLGEYCNVVSVNRLGKWNSDVEEVLECRMCDRTREMKQRCWGSIGI